MPKILTETVDQYVTNLMPDRDEVLTEMEQIAKEQSISIIGPLVGRLLYQMAVMIGARRVFEMGSAIGYSTIWLARAVGPEGKVYYSDGSESNAARAHTFLERLILLTIRIFHFV